MLTTATVSDRDSIIIKIQEELKAYDDMMEESRRLKISFCFSITMKLFTGQFVCFFVISVSKMMKMHILDY